MRRFEDLEYHNVFHELGMNFSTAWLPGKSPGPRLVAFNEETAREIGLDPSEGGRPDAAEILCGNRISPAQKPLVQIYAGHVFGEFVQRLGDGRCILLGEVVGEGGAVRDLQLKGAGKTPLSRERDGRCSLGEAVREYLAGEAMHALGVPTTRFLSIVALEEEVERDGGRERAAVLVRVAPTHVRFGHFEYFSRLMQPGWVRNLAGHVVRVAWPELSLDEGWLRRFLGRVVERTADLVAAWQAVGFCHGRMNTDDMSAAGITLDYGPFGFLGAYDPEFRPNPADREGRYAFGRQEDVALWNLARLGECFLDFLSPDEAMEELRRYRALFRATYHRRMGAKIGLEGIGADDDLAGLLGDLLAILQAQKIDYTRFFRALSDSDRAVLDLAPEPGPVEAWLARRAAALGSAGGGDDARREAMRGVNPARIPRRALLDDTVRKAGQGDWGEIDRVRRLLADPFRGIRE